MGFSRICFTSFKSESGLFTHSDLTEFIKRRKDIRMKMNGKITY